MERQTSIPTAANVLGLIGTVCWCVQLIPQIWRNYRTKSTEGLPATMMLLWSTSGVPFGIYAISQNFNIPLQIQPQCFCLLCMVSWGQCKVYSRSVSRKQSCQFHFLIVIANGGLGKQHSSAQQCWLSVQPYKSYLLLSFVVHIPEGLLGQSFSWGFWHALC